MNQHQECLPQRIVLPFFLTANRERFDVMPSDRKCPTENQSKDEKE